jgi:Type II secretion system (T2SS), protein N
MKTRYYLITGVLAYFCLLFSTVPAAPVYQLFKDDLPGIRINTIGGSLWQGTADTVETALLTLHRVSWSFNGWRLLLAEAAYNIDARYEDKPVTAEVGVGIGGAIHVHGLNTTLDAATVAKLVVLPIGEIAGNVNVAIESATWSKGSVPEISGAINWKKATITVAETAQLGDVNIRLYEADESPLSADIGNSNGQLVISGNLSTQTDGKYTLQLKLKPGPGASQNLVSSLAMLAKKQPDGAYVINNSGMLSQLGLL